MYDISGDPVRPYYEKLEFLNGFDGHVLGFDADACVKIGAGGVVQPVGKLSLGPTSYVWDTGDWTINEGWLLGGGAGESGTSTIYIDGGTFLKDGPGTALDDGVTLLIGARPGALGCGGTLDMHDGALDMNLQPSQINVYTGATLRFSAAKNSGAGNIVCDPDQRDSLYVCVWGGTVERSLPSLGTTETNPPQVDLILKLFSGSELNLTGDASLWLGEHDMENAMYAYESTITIDAHSTLGYLGQSILLDNNCQLYLDGHILDSLYVLASDMYCGTTNALVAGDCTLNDYSLLAFTTSTARLDVGNDFWMNDSTLSISVTSTAYGSSINTITVLGNTDISDCSLAVVVTGGNPLGTLTFIYTTSKTNPTGAGQANTGFLPEFTGPPATSVQTTNTPSWTMTW
jgi:hypothetical protein